MSVVRNLASLALISSIIAGCATSTTSANQESPCVDLEPISPEVAASVNTVTVDGKAEFDFQMPGSGQTAHGRMTRDEVGVAVVRARRCSALVPPDVNSAEKPSQGAEFIVITLAAKNTGSSPHNNAVPRRMVIGDRVIGTSFDESRAASTNKSFRSVLLNPGLTTAGSVVLEVPVGTKVDEAWLDMMQCFSCAYFSLPVLPVVTR